MKTPLSTKEQIKLKLPEGIAICTNEQLAALGEAIVEQILFGMGKFFGDKEEFVTIGKLAKRYHISPVSLRDRLARHGCRTIDPPPGVRGWYRYSATDAHKIMTSNP